MILSASTHRVRPVRAALRNLHTELVFQIREIMRQPDAGFVHGFPSMVAAVAVVLSLHRLSAVLARAGMARPLRLRCRVAGERKEVIPALLRQPRRRR